MSIKDQLSESSLIAENPAKSQSLVQSLKSLRESEEKYRTLFETLTEGMALHEIIWDKEGIPRDYRFLDVNPAYEEATGLRREKIIGKRVQEVQPELESYWIQSYAEAALTGKTLRFESNLQASDKHFLVTMFKPRRGQIATILFNITEQRKAESQADHKTPEVLLEVGDLHEYLSNDLAKRLEESQMLYEISQILAGTTDLSVTLQLIADAAAKLIKNCSQAILHLLSDKENYMQSVAVSGSDVPSKSHRMNFKLGEGIAGIALATGQTINVSDVLTDPRYIPVQSSTRVLSRSLLVAPVKTGERIMGTLSVQSPMTGVFTPDDERLLTILGAQAAVAIKKAMLYEDLHVSLQHEKAARAQLVQSEKLAALGRIVASVAHELNNPLQAIQNALYLINLEESLIPQTREDLKTVLYETDRMADLIARLRETYRPAASEEFHPESLNTIVSEVQRLLSTHLRRNQVAFEFHPDENLPAIPLIRDQVKQVILNISLNAVEAMPEGGKLRIETRGDRQGGGVSLIISDNGPAINPKILPYIFDPFVTTKEGGTGLGLAITYDIVRRHNGHIEVESEPGQGTIFRVWWPADQGFDGDSLKG